MKFCRPGSGTAAAFGGRSAAAFGGHRRLRPPSAALRQSNIRFSHVRQLFDFFAN